MNRFRIINPRFQIGKYTGKLPVVTPVQPVVTPVQPNKKIRLEPLPIVPTLSTLPIIPTASVSTSLNSKIEAVPEIKIESIPSLPHSPKLSLPEKLTPLQTMDSQYDSPSAPPSPPNFHSMTGGKRHHRHLSVDVDEPHEADNLSDSLDLTQPTSAPAMASEPEEEKIVKTKKTKAPVDTVKTTNLRSRLFELKNASVEHLISLSRSGNPSHDYRDVAAAQAITQISGKKSIDPAHLFRECKDNSYKAVWRLYQRLLKEHEKLLVLKAEDEARGITQ